MSKTEKIEGAIEITIWFFSVLCGIAVAVFTVINGAGILKAIVFGFLGAIGFIAVALLIYLIIHSKLTLEMDDK